MEAKRDVAQAVCAHLKEDGVVVPTCSQLKVFATLNVDNLDSKSQGIFS